MAYRKPTPADQLMIDALMALMQQKPFRDISIKELVLTAGVARSSFYRHYKSMDELLMHLCAEEVIGLAEELKKTGTSTNYDVAVAYFRFFQSKQEFLRILRENDLLYRFLQNYDSIMFGVAEEAEPGKDGDPTSAPPLFRYIYYYGMNGLWGMTNKWLLSGCRETPEELASYLMMYFANAYQTEEACRYYDKYGTFPFPSDGFDQL